MDTPEKLTRNGTQEKLKQKHNADSTKKQGLKNIHISNDNGSFTFYVDVFCPLSLPRLLPDLTLHGTSIKQLHFWHIFLLQKLTVLNER
jgi:hypothetical protein